MSLSDPQTVTIAAATSPLPRTSVDKDESEYTSGDGLIKLSVSHSYGKRTRRLIRIDHAKMAPDAFRPSENVQVGMAVYTVFDLPGKGGYNAAEALAVYTGFATLLSASSYATVTKLLGGES
jgi:hypothetical protein